MGIGLTYLQHVMSQRDAQARREQAWRDDPNKLDSLVASVASKISPSGSKPKMKDFQTKTEAYDSLVEPDHPFAGFASELKERMSRALAHPASRGVSPVELADELTAKMLNEPGKSGVSRITEANEFKRRQDARWFGLAGEDASIRKPLGSQYDTWLAERRQQETPEGMAEIYRSLGDEGKAKEVLDDASGVATPGGFALNIGLGAAAGAAFGGGLPGAAIGAVTGGISEILGKPISKAITRSEWYNSLAGPLTASRSETTAGDVAKVAIPTGIATFLGAGGNLKGLVVGGVAAATAGFGITDTGKAFLAEVAPYAAINAGLDKVAFKAFLVPKAAGKAIAANPSAKNMVEAGDAIESSTKIMSDETFVGRFVNKIVNAGDMKLGVNEDFIKELRSFTPGGKRAAILGKAVEEHLSGTKGRWEAMQDIQMNGFATGKYIPELKGATSDEYAAWARKAVSKFDATAHEEAMRHPDGYAAGVEEAAARMKARQLVEDDVIEPSVNFLDDQRAAHRAAMTAKKANYLVEQKLVMENALLNKTTKKAQDKVARVLTETVFTPQEFESDLYAHVASLGIESPVGEAAVSTAAKSAKVVPLKVKPKTIAENVAAIDATPVISEAVRVTSAPTELGAIEADAGMAVSAPARKISAKIARQREELIERRKLASMSDEEQLDYLREKQFDNPINQARWQELLEKRQTGMTLEQKAKDLEELSYHGGGAGVVEDTEGEAIYFGSQKILSSGRAKVKNKTREKLKVATDEEAAQTTEVIRGKDEKAAAVKLTGELEEVKAVENAQFEKAKRIQSLDPDTAYKEIDSVYQGYKAGKVPAEKALDEINEIAEIYADPKVIDKNFSTDAGLENWLGMSDAIVRELRAAATSKAIIGVTALGVGAASFFLGGNDAHAGVFSEGLVKGLAKAKDIPKATLELMNAAKEAKYVVPLVEDPNKFLLALNDFQVGLKGGAVAIINDFKSWASKAPEKSFRLSHMSPDKVLDEVTGTGKGLMTNVAPFKASFQAAEYKNIVNGKAVVKNIVTASDIKSARKEVEEIFAPLNEKFSRQIEFDWRNEEVKNLTKRLDEITKNTNKHSDDVVVAWRNETQKDLDNHVEKLKGLQGAVEDFHKSWEPVAAQAAKEHSAVRTFLALGDNAEFEKYPFLKSITFTNDEKVAIGRMREQLLQYKQRLKEVDADVIEGPYAHHVLHPGLDTSQFYKMMGGKEKAAAYLKIYRRSFNSRPLMPDLESSMEHYVTDTERRIQQRTFWKKEGWDVVLKKSENFPVIHKALTALKEGVASVDNTNTNKLLQRYQEFESVMRLFLSPSATLKHLIKETGDLAQRGFGETVESYPLATKMTGIRIAEANPMVRKSLTKLGFTAKNDQDRLLQEYFKSVVPVQGGRARLLDIGLTTQDDIFRKADGLWGKIQDVGSMGINFAELAGRGLSTVLGLQMAAKKGMTIEQGLYGTYDMILKNNFLSREFNPAWLQHPGVKAAFMFQGTPFKIMERRVVNFMRSGRVVKDIGEAVYNATKEDYKNGNFRNSREILKQLFNIRTMVKEGEHRVTSNIFLDAALKETDFFGTPVVNQLAKDVFIIGAATYGGASAGVNLYHHFFHIPFLKSGQTYSTDPEPKLAVNPGISAIFKGMDAWQKRDENDDEWLTTKIFNKWLGGGFYSLIPDPIKKLHRISVDDIPEIYKKDPYKYLFAVPSVKPSKRQ